MVLFKNFLSPSFVDVRSLLIDAASPLSPFGGRLTAFWCYPPRCRSSSPRTFSQRQLLPNARFTGSRSRSFLVSRFSACALHFLSFTRSPLPRLCYTPLESGGDGGGGGSSGCCCGTGNDDISRFVNDIKSFLLRDAER